MTSEDARELGIPVVELGKLAYHGRLERVAYGIYRFDELPVTPVDSYQLAVLWAGGRAVLSPTPRSTCMSCAISTPLKFT